MKKFDSKIARLAKIISVAVFVMAVSINGAFAQISEQEYFKQQIAELTKQIASKPKDDKLYVRRGEIFLKLTYPDPESALDDAQKALAINPKNQAAVKLKETAAAQSFFTGNLFAFESDENENHVEKSAKPAAKPTPIPAAKPANNVSKPADNENIADLTKKIAGDSQNDQLYVERGNFYLKGKKLAEALADAEKALRLRASNDEALMLRGDVKAAKNDFAGAETDYKQAVKLRNDTGIAGRIVSHSGKTLTGIVVKGKLLGDSSGYASLDEIKKDWGIPLTELKVIVQGKNGRLSVYEGIAVVDSAVNIKNASLAERPAFNREPSIFTSFAYLKLVFDQSLFLPKKDKLTSRQETEIADILDISGLSVVRRQSFPFASGNNAFLNLIEAEVSAKRFDEAKTAYLNLEKKFKSANPAEIKSVRIDSLKILYKSFNNNLTAFVEDEMKKHNFSAEEKQRVKYTSFYV